MNVYLTALGCRLNEAELASWARQFSQRGATLVPKPGEADLIVVNTCAVTAEAARKSRRLLRRTRRGAAGAKLIVSGCYASLEPDAAQACGIDLLIDNAAKPALVDRVLTAFPHLSSAASPAPAQPRANRTRAFVKIQDGCRHRCSYCIVTVARGAERSVPVAAVIDEINRLHAEGVQEAVLTGVHVGGYGTDLGLSLTALVRALLRETSVPRLRLASVEPWDLGAEFFELYDNARLQPHLHLPLQSGCDSTLRRMARRGRVRDFERLLAHARRTRPQFNVTTDVIVGFPGETETDWRSSLEAIERLRFGAVHVFPYSARAGTAAARFPQQIPAATISLRGAELRALAMRMQGEFLHANVGRRESVLFESAPIALRNGIQRWSGYTSNYLRATVDVATRSLQNRIEAVELTEWVADEALLRAGLVGSGQP